MQDELKPRPQDIFYGPENHLFYGLCHQQSANNERYLTYDQPPMMATQVLI